MKFGLHVFLKLKGLGGAGILMFPEPFRRSIFHGSLNVQVNFTTYSLCSLVSLLMQGNCRRPLPRVTEIIRLVRVAVGFMKEN